MHEQQIQPGLAPSPTARGKCPGAVLGSREGRMHDCSSVVLLEKLRNEGYGLIYVGKDVRRGHLCFD